MSGWTFIERLDLAVLPRAPARLHPRLIEILIGPWRLFLGLCPPYCLSHFALDTFCHGKSIFRWPTHLSKVHRKSTGPIFLQRQFSTRKSCRLRPKCGRVRCIELPNRSDQIPNNRSRLTLRDKESGKRLKPGLSGQPASVPSPIDLSRVQ